MNNEFGPNRVPVTLIVRAIIDEGGELQFRDTVLDLLTCDEFYDKTSHACEVGVDVSLDEEGDDE